MSNEKPNSKNQISVFASLELAITLMSLTAMTVLIGAWCPQESQVGRDKVFETFGLEMGKNLIQWGVSDIFHSPWFLFLIAMMTVNMVAVSFQRVFPKARLIGLVMPFLQGKAIRKMPVSRTIYLDKSASAATVLSFLVNEIGKKHFTVRVANNSISGEYGKYGRLAATITHIGLLSLLAGVTVTSWTGFSGFQPVRMGDTMSLGKSDHSKLWIGKLPAWSVRVDSTRRENYESGEAKQWYSELSVIDGKGKILKKGEISVNNPLSYDGVDIYQSSWGLDVVDLSFNGNDQRMALEPMGKKYAAFLPLDQKTILIFSLLDQSSPLKVFAKRAEWQTPKLITDIKATETASLGSVDITYKKVFPISGLQYKCDPGLPIVYTAFGFIMLGVLLAAIPHRHIWASVDEDEEQPGRYILSIGGKSIKARTGFERLLTKLVESLEQFRDPEHPVGEPQVVLDKELQTPAQVAENGMPSQSTIGDDRNANDANGANDANDANDANGANDARDSAVDGSKSKTQLEILETKLQTTHGEKHDHQLVATAGASTSSGDA